MADYSHYIEFKENDSAVISVRICVALLSSVVVHEKSPQLRKDRRTEKWAAEVARSEI